jgi:dihydropyrimidinase
MFDLVIQNATVVTPYLSTRANVGIRGEKIAAVDFAPMSGIETIDASGKYLLPGVIDTHLHLQPEIRGDAPEGLTPWADGYDSGTLAAAFGGVTTVIDMRIQQQRQGASAMDAVIEGLEDASRKAVVDFSFHAGLTYPSPETLAEIPKLVAMGIPSFKFFLTYPNWHIRVDLGFVYEAFLAIGESNGIAAVHAEDDQIIEHLKRKFVLAGREDLACYSLARPDFAEEMAINNIGILSRETGARAYAVHVSSRKGLDAGRRAKAAGAPFFMECVPHYLTFTDDVFRLDPERAAQFVMGPPYRTDSDITALWEGIGDGSIDWMGSDHSPYRRAQKTKDLRFYSDPAGTEGGIEYAIPTGIGGVELLLPIMLSEGVNKGRITLQRLVELMCAAPARRLGLSEKGAIKVGMDADLVLVDLDQTKTVRNDDLHSNTDFTLYEGLELRGWPIATVSRGKIIVKDNSFVGSYGHGRLVRRRL